jgi:starvation-inducible DNA-binding protein
VDNWNGFRVLGGLSEATDYDPALDEVNNLGCSCGAPLVDNAGDKNVCLHCKGQIHHAGRTAAKSSDLVDHLKKCLAEATILYHMSHGFHWNVKGPDFQEYHSLFETIYSDIYESLDPIAENIVKLGNVAPFSLKTLLELSDIKEVGDLRGEPHGLTKTLQSKNAQIIKSLKDCFDKANKDNEQGVANFIAERIDMHQKWDWQLKASLGI